MGALTREKSSVRLARARRKLLARVDAVPEARHQRWAALNAVGAVMKHMSTQDHAVAVQRLKDLAAEFAKGGLST